MRDLTVTGVQTCALPIWRQAAVVAGDGLTADGLSTALTVLDDSGQAALLRSYPGVVAEVWRGRAGRGGGGGRRGAGGPPTSPLSPRAAAPPRGVPPPPARPAGRETPGQAAAPPPPTNQT